MPRGKISIGNKRTKWQITWPKPNEVCFHIDRGTPLGNPYKIGPDGDRDTVVEGYDAYARGKMKHDPQFSAAVAEIAKHVEAGNDVKLMCWCAPLNCHGRVVKKLVEEWLDEGE